MHTDSPPSGHGEDLVRFPSETIHRVTLLGAPEKGKPLRAWGVEEDSWVIEAFEAWSCCCETRRSSRGLSSRTPKTKSRSESVRLRDKGRSAALPPAPSNPRAA
jgi:hypothetical protein